MQYTKTNLKQTEVCILYSLVEGTGVAGENKRPVASHSTTLSHNVVSSTPCR